MRVCWNLRIAGFVVLGTAIVGAVVADTGTNLSRRLLDPAAMPAIGTVDTRFQSYNVEMVEVTGGRFWKPYNSTGERTSAGATPAGMDPGLFEYRAPIDLSNPRLRRLAAALGPAYVRVSGTWANTVYFDDADSTAASKPPRGFGAVLTRAQWKGVVDFSQAVNARIITSFATGAGNRDAKGEWIPDQARRFLAYDLQIGGDIAAAEFMNEPTYAEMGGAPAGYDAAAFGRDLKTFLPFLREEAPGILFLGPGSVGEGGVLQGAPSGRMLSTEDLLKASGPVFDVFSYHLYAAASQRCANLGPTTQTSASQALTRAWLSRIASIDRFYSDLANRYVPGKPRWITETADAACGGNPWASTFLDTFRYLEEHGRLAQLGVRVIAHNTLASSDYGLLDPDTYAPRPNYWAALLWNRLMDRTVLDPGTVSDPSVRLYAHCQKGQPGGVALLAMNLDRRGAHAISLSIPSSRYSMTASKPDGATIAINGSPMNAGQGGELPEIRPVAVHEGSIDLPPASISFFAIPNARNGECQ